MTAAHSAESRPQPVLTRAAIVTVLAVLSALLVKLGAGSVSTWLDHNSDAIAGAVLMVAPVVSAWLAKRHVTPLADPRDADGNKLAPATVDDPLDDGPSASTALAEADEIHPAD